MIDPYRVLEISKDATPEEIKKAYRKKALQYHPDRNQGSKEAEERMKEINEAYAMLTDPNYKPNNSAHQGYGAGYGPYGGRSGSSQYGGQTGYGPFGGFGFDPFGGAQGGYQARPEGSPELRAARNYVMNGYYQQALSALEQVSERSAEWYYLSAQAHMGMGDRVIARDHARTACGLDPDNFEYRLFLQQLEQSAASYRSRGGLYGMNASALCRHPCVQCVAINMLLNCLCGGYRYC